MDLTGPDLPSRTKQAKLRGKQSGLVSPPLTEGTMNLSDSDEMYPDGSEEEELADSQEEGKIPLGDCTRACGS